MREEYQIPKIDDDGAAKVLDLYKMYADRATAIRAIMILLVPVATATVSAAIALRGDLQKPAVVAILLVVGLFVLGIGVFLRLRLNVLLDDYESMITVDQVRAYRLLPLDSLQSARAYQGDGEGREGRVLTFANVVSIAAALICTGLLVGLVILQR